MWIYFRLLTDDILLDGSSCSHLWPSSHWLINYSCTPRPPHTPSTQSQSRVQCVAAAHSSSLPSAPRQKLSIHQRINYSTQGPPRHEEKKLEYPHLWGWGRGAKIGRREAVDYSIQHTHIWIGRAGLKLLSTLDKVAQKLVFGGDCKEIEKSELNFNLGMKKASPVPQTIVHSLRDSWVPSSQTTDKKVMGCLEIPEILSELLPQDKSVYV